MSIPLPSDRIALSQRHCESELAALLTTPDMLSLTMAEVMLVREVFRSAWTLAVTDTYNAVNLALRATARLAED